MKAASKKSNKTAVAASAAAVSLPPWARLGNDCLRIRIHVTPRASRSELTGTHGDALSVRLQAPPVDGKANEALRKFFAELLDLPKSSVSLVSGETSREKTLALPNSPDLIAAISAQL